MANNIITEIKKLIQQIKNEYRKGVDFEIVSDGENEHPILLEIKSPHLKRFLRERFSIPILVKDYFLDYYQSDLSHNHFLYRVEKVMNADSLSALEKTKLWNETENCKQCNKLVSQKKGWIQQWDGRKIGNGPTPNIIGHFHPECAKKYFANKKQPNENNVRIKEKLLRNLDKICLDPIGYIVNAELLKNDKNVLLYNKGICGSDMPAYKDFEAKVQKVEIEGEIIDLEITVNANDDLYREIKKAIINEIKENKNDWQIKGPVKGSDIRKMVQHKSGWRHFEGLGFIKEWDEIEATLKGSKLPKKNNQPRNSELVAIKNIFQKYNIRNISYEPESGKLFINYMNNSEKKVNNSEFKELESYCREHSEKELDRQKLGLDKAENNSSDNSNSNKNNHQLAIGLFCGAGIVILVGVIFYFVRKRIKKSK